jgi:hypothetical protein
VFIQETVGLQGDPIFCDVVVAELRPVPPLVVPWAIVRSRLKRLDRAMGTPLSRAGRLIRRPLPTEPNQAGEGQRGGEEQPA